MAGKVRCTLEFEKNKKDLITNKRENIEDVERTEKEKAWLYAANEAHEGDTRGKMELPLSSHVSLSRPVLSCAHYTGLQAPATHAASVGGQLDTHPRH